MFRRLQRVDEQHRTRHRADAAGHGGDPGGHFAYTGEVDVTAELPFVVGVHADVDDDGAGLDVLTAHEPGPAHGDDEDVGVEALGDAEPVGPQRPGRARRPVFAGGDPVPPIPERSPAATGGVPTSEEPPGV